MKISFDDRQISRIREALKRPTQPFWKSDGLLNVIQTLALVVGGCWVLVQFLLYQRAETQLRHAELSQSIKLKELQAQLSEQKKRRQDREFTSLTTYRFSLNTEIKAEMTKSAGVKNPIYNVNYDVKMENMSDEPFEISLWILDYFIGQNSKELEASGLTMEPVGMPAGRWTSKIDGSVRWKLAGSKGSVLADATGEIAKQWKAVGIQQGGVALLGTLKEDQIYRYNEDFVVSAPMGVYVAFVLSVCFNKCASKGDFHTEIDYILLPKDSEKLKQ